MCFPTWMSTAMPIRVSSAPTSHSSFWRCAFTKSPSSSMVVFKYFNYCLVLEKLSSMSFRCHSAWCCRRCVSRHPYLLPSSLTLTLESTPSSPLYVCIIHEVFFSFLSRCSFTQWLPYCMANKRHSHTEEYAGLLAWRVVHGHSMSTSNERLQIHSLLTSWIRRGRHEHTNDANVRSWANTNSANTTNNNNEKTPGKVLRNALFSNYIYIEFYEIWIMIFS